MRTKHSVEGVTVPALGDCKSVGTLGHAQLEDKERGLFPGMSVLTKIIQKLTAAHFQASNM